jgi:hypothetical protein
MNRRIAWMVAAIGLVAPTAARAQNDLAVRTSGSVLRPGDQLRVELLALEEIPGPLVAQLTYRYSAPVTVRDEDGKETTRVETRTRQVPAAPQIMNLDRFRSIVLDDTFHLGEGSAGEYTIEVAILTSGGRSTLGTIRSCVFYQKAEEAGCRVFVRGLKRAERADWLVLDGVFASEGRYTATILRANQVLAHAQTVFVGPNELHIVAPEIARFAGDTVDIVVHNHTLNLSSTLARVVVPSGQQGHGMTCPTRAP